MKDAIRCHLRFRRDSSMLAPRRRAPVALGLLVLVGGCSAVYPEVGTPIRPAPAGRELTPASPEDLYYITFKSAEIPRKTRDGRRWDAVGGEAPDPFALLFVNDAEVIRTPVQSNTLEPTWPNQKKQNYRILRGSKLRVELWDSNPINNHPICVKKIASFASEMDLEGNVALRCDSGARIVLAVESARPKMGLGFYYELRTTDIFVTRAFQESPAGRSGLSKGDQIVKIQGKETKGMDEGEVRSLINANAPIGVTLTIKRKADGKIVDVSIKNGPIYATGDEGIHFD